MSHRGVPLYATCENNFLSSMFVEQRLSTRSHTLQHKDVRVITVFFSLFSLVLISGLLSIEGKNPHSGCLFLKSSVTEYVTHNSRLIFLCWHNDSHELCFWFVSPPSSSALDDGVIVGKHWLSHNFHLCYLLSCEELLTVLWPAFVNTNAAQRCDVLEDQC